MNILEVNYSSTYFVKIKNKITLFFFFKKLLNSIIYTIKHLIKDLLSINKKNNFKNNIICLETSVNQKKALEPLVECSNKFIFVGLTNRSDNKIPMGFGCILGFLLFPVFIYDYIHHKNHRNKILYLYESYFFIRGMFLWWIVYLYMNKPNALIVSNDHLVWHRVLRMAAQYNEIPVIYIQHASVTDKFPKLEFNLSLLEGRDSYLKYSKKGISSHVNLVGMIKYDKYHKYINKEISVQAVGICTNLLDNESMINQLVTNLSYKLKNILIVLRPHPGDSRDYLYNNLGRLPNVSISNSKTVNSFDFLKKIDINIASESSIHLEAALLNVYPIYFRLNKVQLDYYGFIENGLITDIPDNIDRLNSLINKLIMHRPNIRYRSKYYIDTIDTPYDGKSNELALSIIYSYI